jgi:hypothetical protein
MIPLTAVHRHSEPGPMITQASRLTKGTSDSSNYASGPICELQSQQV